MCAACITAPPIGHVRSTHTTTSTARNYCVYLLVYVNVYAFYCVFPVTCSCFIVTSCIRNWCNHVSLNLLCSGSIRCAVQSAVCVYTRMLRAVTVQKLNETPHGHEAKVVFFSSFNWKTVTQKALINEITENMSESFIVWLQTICAPPSFGTYEHSERRIRNDYPFSGEIMSSPFVCVHVVRAHPTGIAQQIQNWIY